MWLWFPNTVFPFNYLMKVNESNPQDCFFQHRKQKREHAAPGLYWVSWCISPSTTCMELPTHTQRSALAFEIKQSWNTICMTDRMLERFLRGPGNLPFCQNLSWLAGWFSTRLYGECQEGSCTGSTLTLRIKTDLCCRLIKMLFLLVEKKLPSAVAIMN